MTVSVRVWTPRPSNGYRARVALESERRWARLRGHQPLAGSQSRGESAPAAAGLQPALGQSSSGRQRIGAKSTTVARGDAALRAMRDVQANARYLAVCPDPNAYRHQRIGVLAVSNGRAEVLVDPHSCPAPGELWQLSERPWAAFPAKPLHRLLFTTLGAAPQRWACIRLSEQLLASGRDWPMSLGDIAGRHGLGTPPDPNRGLDALAAHARWLHELVAAQIEALKQAQLSRVSRIEARAVAPIAEMEAAGMPFDRQAWAAVTHAVETERVRLRQTLAHHLGSAMAPSLLGEDGAHLETDGGLKEALRAAGYNVPNVKRETLANLPEPVGPLLSRFRETSKLASTYGQSFLEFCDPDGRIRPTFEQIGASTGRMACHAPNLQAMVSSSAHRRCFRSAPEARLVIADYAACELRILAQVSEDPTFRDAFAQGEDVHARVASALFDRPVSKTENPELRQRAKAINFGIVYGMGPAGLARALGLSKQAANNLLDTYFHRFPRLQAYLHDAEQTGLRRREARTLTGRRLLLPSDADRGYAQRLARNMPIQGTSADMTKLALAKAYCNLPAGAKLVNAIHDELVVECPAAAAEQTAAALVESMQSAGAEMLPSVPLAVDAHIAQYWDK